MASSWNNLRACYKNNLSTVYFQDKKRLLFARQNSTFQRYSYDGVTAVGEKKDTATALPSVYSPLFVEAAWYEWWLKQGFFTLKAQKSVKDEEKFVMLLPPPNVTGTLHLGHALTNSIQDALVRWHRMKGHSTLWVPGLDHAGIATQVMVEKMLWARSQQTRHQLGRDMFVSQVWKWKEEKGDIIEQQMKKLGSSFDWSRSFFTLDKNLSPAIDEAFIRLHSKGRIYRDRQLVNWSCSLQSSVSDIEVEKVSVNGRTQRPVPGYEEKVEFGVLYFFAYPIENSDEEIVVATTRLETMLGDSAVAVHPDDPRFSHLIGRRIQHPLLPRTLPIIADTFVDREFGSGAVKVTPGHDSIDLQICRKHGLSELSILDDEGKLSKEAGQEFCGLKRFTARKKIQEALQSLGLFRGEREHAMVLPVCSRTGDVIELRLKEQWFLKCQQMAERAIHAVQTGRLTFSAPYHEALWFEWLNKDKDWCLSRQLWWGHRIPAYRLQTPKGEVWVTARSEDEAVENFFHQFPLGSYQSISQEEDVLDTWFSAALLPFSVFGWPTNTPDLQDLYPLSLMETGNDILFFWVARMVMLGLELTDCLPFNHVLLHGILRDRQGRKMSKSLGNVIDPLDIIHGASLQDLHAKLDKTLLNEAEIATAKEGQKKDFPQGIPECGADALRFTLCSYDFKASEIHLDILHAKTSHSFCNKIWQAFRFMQQHIGTTFIPLSSTTLFENGNALDRWLLSRLSDLVLACDNAFKTHNLQQATKALHQFWITEFCDVYLECSKSVFRYGDEAHQEVVQQILYFSMESFLRMLSPFMPYLTEELFQRLPVKSQNWPESICIASFPAPDDYPWRNEKVDKEMSHMLSICHHLRSLRHEYNVGSAIFPVFILVENERSKGELAPYVRVLQSLAKTSPVEIITDKSYPIPPGCATIFVDSGCRLFADLKCHVDITRELERLCHKQDKLKQTQMEVVEKLHLLQQKGKTHLPLAQKLQHQEADLANKLKSITEAMENLVRLKNT